MFIPDPGVKKALDDTGTQIRNIRSKTRHYLNGNFPNEPREGKARNEKVGRLLELAYLHQGFHTRSEPSLLRRCPSSGGCSPCRCLFSRRTFSHRRTSARRRRFFGRTRCCWCCFTCSGPRGSRLISLVAVNGTIKSEELDRNGRRIQI
jgi:hypothetical protein